MRSARVRGICCRPPAEWSLRSRKLEARTFELGQDREGDGWPTSIISARDRGCTTQETPNLRILQKTVETVET